MEEIKYLLDRLVEKKIIAEWVVDCVENNSRHKANKIVRAYKHMIIKRDEANE